jgi:hypothetical protein
MAFRDALGQAGIDVQGGNPHTRSLNAPEIIDRAAPAQFVGQVER